MQTGNRSKRTKIFAGLLSLAVLVSLPRLGWSQRQARVMIRPSVDSIEDAKGQKLDDIVLKHGDRPMIIMVKGKNLHLVKRAQLFLGNTRVQKRNVEVKVVEAKPTQLKLSLQVKTATIQGTGYYLKLQDERQNGLANVKASRFSLGAQLARVAARKDTSTPKPGAKTVTPRPTPGTRTPARPAPKPGVKTTVSRSRINPEITGVSTKALRLKPGGKEKVLTIQGQRLAKVASVQILKNGKPVGKKEINARIIGTPSANSVEIAFKAMGSAKEESNYQVAFIDASQRRITEIPLAQTSVSVGNAIAEVFGPKPDLIVPEVKILYVPEVGDQPQLQISLINFGEVEATFPERSKLVSVEFTHDAEPYHKWTNSTRSISYPAEWEWKEQIGLRASDHVRAGDYWLTVKVDPDNVVRESDENNNSTSLKYTIAGAPEEVNALPDLVITDVKVLAPFTTENQNEDHLIRVSILNQGSRELRVNSGGYWILNKPWRQLHAFWIESLNDDPWNTEEVRHFKDYHYLEPGTHEWTFQANLSQEGNDYASHRVEESNFDNNFYRVRIEIKENGEITTTRRPTLLRRRISPGVPAKRTQKRIKK